MLLTHLIDDGSNVVLDEFRSQEGTDEKAKGVVIRHVFDNLNSKTRTATQSSHGGTQTKLIQVSGQECRKVATKVSAYIMRFLAFSVQTYPFYKPSLFLSWVHQTSA